MKKLGAEGKFLGITLPVFFIALILHFVVFMVYDGFKTGFIGGILWAIGLVIGTLFATLIYNGLTKAKEKLLSGYFVYLTYTIILTILFKIYMIYAPKFGL